MNDRLAEVAATLKAGGDARTTPRQLLGWFDAQRRGYWIVDRIRVALKQAGLETDPDFESAYIDSPISIVLVERPSRQSSPETSASDKDHETSPPPAEFTRFAAADPTYRISKLEAANKEVVSIKPNAALDEAVTLMISNNYSQLPVMPNNRDVKGVISWSSIGQRLALTTAPETRQAQDFMEPHREIPDDESIFTAISIISKHDYVLVRTKDRRITGVVTASDLNLQFQQLAEPFLLLGEIENSIRRAIESMFTLGDLRASRDPNDNGRVVGSVADLTFGEYIRLLSSDERWAKLGWRIDRKTFIAKLDRIRMIRNDVMHFDPDGIPETDLRALRDFAAFLQRIYALGLGGISTSAHSAPT